MPAAIDPKMGAIEGWGEGVHRRAPRCEDRHDGPRDQGSRPSLRHRDLRQQGQQEKGAQDRPQGEQAQGVPSQGVDEERRQVPGDHPDDAFRDGKRRERDRRLEPARCPEERECERAGD